MGYMACVEASLSDYIMEREGRYYYYRRVPHHLKRLDSRKWIRIALNTADRAEASRRAFIQNEMVEKFWQGLITNPQPDKTVELYREAVATARSYGFAYKSLPDLVRGGFSDLAERLTAVGEANDRTAVAAALLGSVDAPKLKWSMAVDRYFELTPDRLINKSPLAVRKWQNPRRRAVVNLIAAMGGDKPVVDTTRRDLLDMRKWWQERCHAGKGGLNPLSANKDFKFLKDIYRVIVTDLELEDKLDVGVLFHDLHLRAPTRSRVPFDAEYVQKTLLAAKAMSGLNHEAQSVIFMMADTGARVSEVTGLLPADIVLDAEIPHIIIRPNAIRQLKNRSSERDIPLVGVSLHAAKIVAATGFPRYAGSDTLSNTINKYWDENKLRPEKSQSLYSLRHTFKDRLRDVQAPEEIVDTLMGHASSRPTYGRGHLLKTKYEWLKKIAFIVPR